MVEELNGLVFDDAFEVALGRVIVTREGFRADGQAHILPVPVVVEIGAEAGDARAHIVIEKIVAVAGELAAPVLVVAVDFAVFVAVAAFPPEEVATSSGLVLAPSIASSRPEVVRSPEASAIVASGNEDSELSVIIVAPMLEL